MLNFIAENESIQAFIICLLLLIEIIRLSYQANQWYQKSQMQQEQQHNQQDELEMQFINKQENVKQALNQQKVEKFEIELHNFKKDIEEIKQILTIRNGFQNQIELQNDQLKILKQNQQQQENKIKQQIEQINQQQNEKFTSQIENIKQEILNINNQQNKVIEQQNENQTLQSTSIEELNQLSAELISLEKQLITISTVQIISQDQSRLKKTQSFVYKLYDDTCNKRAVDIQFKPFVRDIDNFDSLAKNYSLDFKSKMEIKKQITSYQPVRGDGNCFYTAFGFQFFKNLLSFYSLSDFENFINHCLAIKLPMKLKLSELQNEIIDEQLQQDLLFEFLYRLQEIRNIENLDQRIKHYEKQFAAYQQINDEIDGCFYALQTIFLRNYSEYAVEFHQMKDALFDRQNLIIWEKECNSNEIVIDALAKKLNLAVQLFYMDQRSFTLKQYEQPSYLNKPSIILLIKPGHYNVGIKNSSSQLRNSNPLSIYEKLSAFILQKKFCIPENLKLIQTILKNLECQNMEKQNLQVK